MKRNLIILLIVILAGLAGFIYFTKKEVSFSKETSVYKAVPISAPVFVELSALKSIPINKQIIQGFINGEKESAFLELIEKIDTLIKNEKGVQNNLRNESFILAFDWVGENQLYPLIIKKAENGGKRKALENLLQVLFPENQNTFVNKNYSGFEITTITSPGNTHSFNYSFVGGLFLASSKSLLIEKCIRQLNRQSILENKYFSKVNKTVTSQSEISWYINHNTFPEILSNWINGTTNTETNEFGNTSKNNYKKTIGDFKKFADWTELDLEFGENKVTLNGISIASDSLNHFLSIFEGQEPVRFQADEALPKNTSFFASFTFSNKNLFFENLENYFTHADSYYKREEQIKKIESAFRTDLKTSLKTIAKDEVIVASTAVPSNPQNKTTFFIINTEGKTDAENQLNSLLTSYAQRKGIDANNLKSTYSVDNEMNFSIYNFPFPSLPGIWLGKPFGMAKANFAAFNGNYLVFCNSKKGLEEYLHNMVLEASLAKDIQYLRYKQNMVNRANINVYVNVNRIFSINKEIFNNVIAKTIVEKEDYLRKFYAGSWQVVGDNTIYFNSINFTFSENAREEAQTVWQSNVGSGIGSKPQIVKNHNDPVNKEVILQDDQNNLHQITKDGRVRWSVTIQEPILSEIQQVDIYKNGKFQYLFNTKSKLYLLDRDGNNVDRFPITFRSPATNGVSIFDYDNNRNYRYFIACENRKIYVYDANGKIISGWKFGQTDHIVTTPINHFRVNNKDYIVFKDKSRIYFQNRKGETRLNSTAKFENSDNPLILDLNGTPKIVATDNSGTVFYLYFNGKFVEKKTDKFSDKHFFTLTDLNGNGILDFIFVDGKELQVINENGKKLFSKKFDNLIVHKPNIYSFAANQKKVGIVDSRANRIYLFGADGKLHDGFPLQGNSEFSISKISQNSGNLNMVVGSEGGDLYNYSLN